MELDELGIQQDAIAALGFVAAATRHQDDIVRLAASAGVPKQQIHRLTGLARSTIDRIVDRGRINPPTCDYCLHDHYRRLREDEAADPIRAAEGYLIYRVGNRAEIVAQKLCAEHLRKELDGGLPRAARSTWCPHLPNTPSRIVYSLGGVRDDRDQFREYFGGFPQWRSRIEPLLTHVGGLITNVDSDRTPEAA
jgi:hypothetical protein